MLRNFAIVNCIIMANWDILNEEFSNLMNSFSDTDWINWENNRATCKKVRRSELQLKARLQLAKLKKETLKDS